jgi:hypothetical protein
MDDVTPEEQLTALAPRTSVIYMLRTAQQHHVQLSAMADQKASILIGASFVVLTLIFGQARSDGLSPPLVILALSALIAASFAVIAVMPRFKVSSKRSDNFNLLFFGSYANLPFEEYLALMNDLIQTDAKVYRAMILDIYQMGRVLYLKKYRFLTYSYMVFLVGLILAFLAALVSYIP